MGRKNKHGYHDQSSASSPGAGDASFNRSPLDIEVMRANLLEAIGEPSHQAAAKLQLILTDMEKKTAELEVAKKLIKKFQQERAEASIYSSESPDPKLQDKIEKNEIAVRQMNDINKFLEEDIFCFEKKVTFTNDERLHLEQKLTRSEEKVQRLLEDVDSLTEGLSNAQKSLEDAKNVSKDMEERFKSENKDMELELKKRAEQICALKSDIKKRELAYSQISANLQAEKKSRLIKEEELNKLTKRYNEAEKILTRTAEEFKKVDQAKKMVTKAHSETEEMRKERNELKILLADELKSGATTSLLEAVKNMKKDLQKFAEQNVACSLKDTVTELQKKGDDDRLRIEELLQEKEELRLEFLDKKTKLMDELVSARDEIHETQITLNRQNQMHMEFKNEAVEVLASKYKARIETINKRVQLIKNEQIKTAERNTELQIILSAAKADAAHYREDAENCRQCIARLEKQLSLSNAAENNTRSELEEVQENDDKLKAEEDVVHLLKKQLADAESWKEDREKEVEAEKLKLNEELTAVRNIVKKVRKERDASMKKWKKMFEDSNEENRKLNAQKMELEMKLGDSFTSVADDSIRSGSELNDSVRSQCESLQEETNRYEKNAATDKEKLDQLSHLASEKESENIVIHRTVEAEKAQLQECGNSSHIKTISELENRIGELQRSNKSMQKRSDEDRQKLESSEAALAVQQELNANISSVAEEMRQRHVKETRTLNEKTKEKDTKIRVYEDQLAEMRDSRRTLVESMESERLVAENEAKKATDELKVCKIALETTLAKAEHSEQELTRVQELERAKLDVLVSLTEEEKEQFRNQSESLRAQLETAQQEFKDKQAELKKQFESESRKLKKAIKAGEEHKANLVKEIKQKDEELLSQKGLIEKHSEELSRLSTTHSLTEQALEELANEIEKREKLHEKRLNEEKEKTKSFEKTVEKSIKFQKLLEKSERNLQVQRIEFSKASGDLNEKLENLERQLSAERAEKNALESSVSEKNARISEITKKLEEVSPKKDRIAQLENRLEVIQTAAKAQQKRLEDDLAEARSALFSTEEENMYLAKKVAEYREKAELADNLADLNNQFSEELTAQMDSEETVIRLEKELLQAQQALSEKSEQQTGLVNELILANQKSEESKTIAVKYRACSELNHKLEEELNLAKIALERTHTASVQEKDNIDDMFPNLDPSVRQLLRLLSGNTNFAYAACGIVTYFALIHLYILL